MEVYALEGQTIPKKCEETKARQTVDPGTGFRYNEGHELSYKDRYYCRGDEKGKVLSKPVMQKVSKALGHNRISVIAASYLNNI